MGLFDPRSIRDGNAWADVVNLPPEMPLPEPSVAYRCIAIGKPLSGDNSKDRAWVEKPSAK